MWALVKAAQDAGDLLRNHIIADGQQFLAGNNDAADVKAAKDAGDLVPMARPNTIADGLQGRLGDLTWPIVRDLVDGVIAISDQDILAAMRICFERMKVCLAPSFPSWLCSIKNQSKQATPAIPHQLPLKGTIMWDASPVQAILRGYRGIGGAQHAGQRTKSHPDAMQHHARPLLQPVSW